MYRIFKRIIHTVTTVTWLVRLEGGSPDGNAVEQEITFPASYAVTEEEVTDTNDIPRLFHHSSEPTIDEGETHE